MHAEHLLELAPQMARDQVQRLFVHRAAFDGVERVALLEPALQLLHQRALARAHRAHQVEHLAALLALQRRRVEVAHDLRHHLLDAEELVGEEVVDLDRLVFEEPLDAGVVGLVDVAHANTLDHVVQAGVRQLRHFGGLFDALEVIEKGPAPGAYFPGRPIFLDEFLKRGLVLLHDPLLWRKTDDSPFRAPPMSFGCSPGRLYSR